MNFSGVQSLRRLRLPAAPALPPDARSPAVLVQLGIGSLSLGVSLGERSAAPAGAAGGENRAPRQGPGHRAPVQPAARKAAAGA